MYRPGDLQAILPACDTTDEDGYCEEWDHVHVVSDARGENGLRGQVAYLPHSCDEWVIGGPKQVLAMIADLRAVLKRWGVDAGQREVK